MSFEKGTIGFELDAATRLLQNAGVQTAARDAQLLIAHFFGMEPGLLRLRLETEVAHKFTEFGAQSYKYDILDARAAGKPVSKIIGKKAFWKEDFRVNGDVLDPRPDTERLIEIALEIPFTRVLDLGTGSGCILISLLQEDRSATGIGTDISDKALKVAGLNSADAGTTDAAQWMQSDWFQSVSGQFDLIVSNPPYIAASEMAGLQPEVRDHEPRIALTDEADGLACYRTIIAGAPKHLTLGGWLMLEIGLTQAQAVGALMAARGFDAITTRQDLNGHDRVVLGQLSLE